MEDENETVRMSQDRFGTWSNSSSSSPHNSLRSRLANVSSLGSILNLDPTKFKRLDWICLGEFEWDTNVMELSTSIGSPWLSSSLLSRSLASVINEDRPDEKFCLVRPVKRLPNWIRLYKSMIECIWKLQKKLN